MKKIKDISMFLCTVRFFDIIFDILRKNNQIHFYNEISSIAYNLGIYIIVNLPVIYYFIKNNKYERYFEIKKKITFINFCAYWALINFITMILSILLDVLDFRIKIKHVNVLDYSNSNIILNIILGVAVAPILEEILFRGIIMNGLKKYGYKSSIIINSILFGIAHQNINIVIRSFLIGIIFSYIAYKYSLRYSILFHFLLNLLGSLKKIPLRSFETISIFIGILTFVLFLFFIIGIFKGTYKEIFSIFKINREDVRSMAIFCKNNALFLFIILGIMFSNYYFVYL